MFLSKSCLFVKWEERYVTKITSEGRDEWKFFTCPWIKVSAERTVDTVREMLTLLANSDTINSPQQASLELNKSPQRWLRADHPEMKEHDELTLALTIVHGGERPTETAKSKNLWCCPGGMHNCSGMNREGQGAEPGAWIILLSSLKSYI